MLVSRPGRSVLFCRFPEGERRHNETPGGEKATLVFVDWARVNESVPVMPALMFDRLPNNDLTKYPAKRINGRMSGSVIRVVC